jgi:glycerate dehydrogenase
MKQVLVTFQVTEEQREMIEKDLEDLAEVHFLSEAAPGEREELLKGADVLLSWNPKRELDAEELSLPRKAGFMELLSAGVDHLPYDQLPEQMSIAANAGGYAEPMAEHVMAMLLALAKDLRGGQRKLAAGNFDQFTPNRQVAGMTAVILGYGGIGRATARRMKAFDMRVVGANRTAQGDQNADAMGTLKDMDTLLPQADVLVISLPLTDETRGLIGAHELGLMKPDAILINVARGEIIVEPELYEHLRNHPNFLAGIDAWWTEPFRHGVFRMNYPFLELANVLGTPHNSGMVPGATEEALHKALDNVRHFLLGQPVNGVVDRSEYLPRESAPAGRR